MAFPTIIFNVATGSDTAASGAGPATAVSGLAAAHTGGVPSTTITLTNTPNLSGVATDGSHCLWLNTVSGRQFVKITAKDDVLDTVTVEFSFTIAAGSAVDYAIGGKRKFLDNADSRTLFSSSGVRPGWTILVEDAQTLTSALTLDSAGTASDPITFTGPSGRARITQAANNSGTLEGDFRYWKLRRLILDNSFSGVKSGCHAIGYVMTGIAPSEINDCVLGDAINWVNNGIIGSGSMRLTLLGCEITSHGDGVFLGGVSGGLAVVGCYIHDNSAEGIDVEGPAAGLVVLDSIVANNTGNGILLFSSQTISPVVIINNTVHGNGSDGISIADGEGSGLNLVIIGNNIVGNAQYGIRGTIDGWTDRVKTLIDFNNVWNNGAGRYLYIADGAHDISVNPEYPGGEDFSVGTGLKAKGYPDATTYVGIGSTTRSYVDMGAAQRQEVSSVGSCPVVGDGVVVRRGGSGEP